MKPPLYGGEGGRAEHISVCWTMGRMNVHFKPLVNIVPNAGDTIQLQSNTLNFAFPWLYRISTIIDVSVTVSAIYTHKTHSRHTTNAHTSNHMHTVEPV